MGGVIPLDVTNRFVVDFARRHGGRVLDYGCGAGHSVTAGLVLGIDIYGADVFYGGSQTRRDAEATGLFRDRIREMSADHIPFEDASFHLVTNNQVMEHVEDLDATLREIARVLKPGGVCLSVFPSRDVWREGHIGIPFAHRLPKGSQIRFLYTWALRTCGLGTWKEQAPTNRQWAIDKLDWIDRWTHYRSRAEIFSTYNRYFESELRERAYILYRLRDSPSRVRRALARTVEWPLISDVQVALFRKLAFLVIVSRKR